MNKDPAFLFYPSDFSMGTSLFSYEEKGQYIHLLCLQHQTGHLSLEDINLITKSERVKSKFVLGNDGKYHNLRLHNEILKRNNYCNSRRMNKLGKVKSKKHMKNICKSYVEHMGNENININTNINSIKDDKFLDKFDEFRKLYLGTKKGNNTEFKNFKKHNDWKECIELLKPALEKEIEYKSFLVKTNQFCPQWKNLSTWINQRCWEEEHNFNVIKPKNNSDITMQSAYNVMKKIIQKGENNNGNERISVLPCPEAIGVSNSI